MAPFTPKPTSCASSSGSEHVESVAADAERKQRKKLQNRLNQRAHRDRMKDKDKRSAKSSRFETSRWRMDEYEYFEAPRAVRGIKERNKTGGVGSEKKTELHSQLILSNRPAFQLPSVFHSLSLAQVEQYAPYLGPWAKMRSGMPGASPYSDHLLTLVNYNTFRGMFTNKALLSVLSQHFPKGSSTAVNILEGLPGQATVIPSSPNIPTSLVPTRRQMTILHATWMDFFPFPQMRDNLVRHNEEFDHWQFMRDMIGDLIDELYFLRPSTRTSPPGACQISLKDGLDDNLTATRHGLILWGDPHRQDSWEATPGFFQRWGWVAEGCDEIVNSTNYWRALRDEEPIILDSHKWEGGFTDRIADIAG